MNDLKDKVKETAENAVEVAKEVETVAHNTVHPEDETPNQARRRQPWMPLGGAILVGIILFAIYAYFYR
jgi:hypothetical protein